MRGDKKLTVTLDVNSVYLDVDFVAIATLINVYLKLSVAA